MRHDSVVIKSNAHGLTLLLDPDLPFEELLAQVGEKFRSSGNFFKNAQMAVAFRGRSLTPEEERSLVYAITENSALRIACILEEDAEAEEHCREAVASSLKRESEASAEIYRGTLKMGQVFESAQSVLILGDVNPGAKVISNGSIIVLGCCMGVLHAGANGNSECFIAALVLKPKQLTIADRTMVSAITKTVDTGQYAADPKLARIVDGHLKLEALNGRSFSFLTETRSEKEGADAKERNRRSG